MTDMPRIIEALNEYKTLKINKKQLREKVGKKFWDVEFNEGEEAVVNNKDLIFVLQAVKDGRLSVPDLVDWVNVIWFSELYDYSDEYRAAIAAVITELEELDEIDYKLTSEQIDFYIQALEKNKDISELRQVSWDVRLQR